MNKFEGVILGSSMAAAAALGHFASYQPQQALDAAPVVAPLIVEYVVKPPFQVTDDTSLFRGDAPLTTDVCDAVEGVSVGLGMSSYPSESDREIYNFFGGIDEKTGTTWIGGEFLLPKYDAEDLISALTSSGANINAKSYNKAAKVAGLALTADKVILDYAKGAPKAPTDSWDSSFFNYFDKVNVDNAGVTATVAAARVATQNVLNDYCIVNYPQFEISAEEYQRSITTDRRAPLNKFSPTATK